MVDMLTACPSADVRQFILLPQTDLEREVNPALVQSEFWKHGCTHRITDESREIQNARQASDWRLLAERASKEMDPGEADKRFVLELSCVLDGQQRQTLHFRLKTLMRIDHDCRRSTGWRPSCANALRLAERLLSSIAILICLFPAALRAQTSGETNASPFSFTSSLSFCSQSAHGCSANPAAIPLQDPNDIAVKRHNGGAQYRVEDTEALSRDRD